MTIRPAGDRALLVAFGSEISSALHRQVFGLTRALAAMPGLLNLHPAYASVLVEYDPWQTSGASVESAIERALAHSDDQPVEPPRLVEIPVRYGGECSPDLADVARHTGLDPREVIRLHSSVEYLVYFLGFAPGFPYLGGMPERLATPRLDTPRTTVPAGSVAIGGAQTGIYPIASPGGWRIIGRTSVPLYTPSADPPVRLRMGDVVRFVPLDEALP